MTIFRENGKMVRPKTNYLKSLTATGLRKRSCISLSIRRLIPA